MNFCFTKSAATVLFYCYDKELLRYFLLYRYYIPHLYGLFFFKYYIIVITKFKIVRGYYYSQIRITVPIPVTKFSVIRISYDCILADLQILIFKWYL